jgi:hypothetical protein
MVQKIYICRKEQKKIDTHRLVDVGNGERNIVNALHDCKAIKKKLTKIANIVLFIDLLHRFGIHCHRQQVKRMEWLTKPSEAK